MGFGAFAVLIFGTAWKLNAASLFSDTAIQGLGAIGVNIVGLVVVLIALLASWTFNTLVRRGRATESTDKAKRDQQLADIITKGHWALNFNPAIGCPQID